MVGYLDEQGTRKEVRVMEENMTGSDILWLALCIFFESRGEPLEGQVAVAHVIVNRAEERKLSIEDVVKEPHQFQWYNKDTMAAVVFTELGTFFDCVAVVYKCANERLKGKTLRGANHFYNPHVVNPAWAKEMTIVRQIGNHLFLRG